MQDSLIKLSIPYKNHVNKLAWDYIVQLNAQSNNINLAENLDSPEANVDGVIFVLVDFTNYFLGSGKDEIFVNFLVTLSNKVTEDSYAPFCDAWITLQDSCVNLSDDLCDYLKEHDTRFIVCSLDFKKYNSVISFSREYQSRDMVDFYVDTKTSKSSYEVSPRNFIELSPVVITRTIKDYMICSYQDYQKCVVVPNGSEQLVIEGVDKNSFLMPYMAYRDFVNFAVHSVYNQSAVSKEDDSNYFLNLLTAKEDKKEIVFFSKNSLRKDRFLTNFDGDTLSIPSAFWQTLTVLQHYKFWNYYMLYSCDRSLPEDSKLNDYQNVMFARLVFEKESKSALVLHLLKKGVRYEDKVRNPDLSVFKKVGMIHSNELFRLNKLYSNANRTCYFDFSNQTITGNNYVFNDDRLENKTLELSEPFQAELPLKITFTELKHFIGSDLSQKNFMLHIYTDGIRVMLERWSGDNSCMECRVIFNHDMSRNNQRLTI